MSATFNLKILTPERVVLDTMVSQVTARALDGELSVLAHHEPLVTALDTAAIKYWEDNEEKSAAVIGGVLEVSNKQTPPHETDTDAPRTPSEDQVVTIISGRAELDTEIDEARAKQARERAEAEKSQKTDKLDTQLSEMALSRAIARLRAVEIANARRRGGR